MAERDSSEKASPELSRVGYRTENRTIQFFTTQKVSSRSWGKRVFEFTPPPHNKLVPRPLGKWFINHEVDDADIQHAVDLFIEDEGWEADSLELLFENEDETGGGRVKEIFYEDGSQVAILVFAKQLDADKVIHRKDDILEEYKIAVQRHCNVVLNSDDDASSSDEETTTLDIIESLPTDLVEVSDVNRHLTPEEVIRFFENSDISGGGRIVHCIRDDDSYLLTFESTADARRVLQNHVEMPFVLGGKLVNVRAIDKKLLERYPFGVLPSSGVRITGIPGHVSKDEVVAKLVKFGTYKPEGSFQSREEASVIVVYGNTKDVALKSKHCTVANDNDPSPTHIHQVQSTLRFCCVPTHSAGRRPTSYGRCILVVYESFPDVMLRRNVMSGQRCDDVETYLTSEQRCRNVATKKGSPENFHKQPNRAVTSTSDFDDTFLRRTLLSGKWVFVSDSETIYRHLTQRPIETEETQLGAELMVSKNRPSLPIFERVSNTQFALKDLPNDTNSDEIFQFFFLPPSHSVKQVVFGLRRGWAFIEFETERDYEHLYLHTLQKPLNGKLIAIERIPQVFSLEIQGPSAHKLAKSVMEIAFKERVVKVDRNTDNVIIAEFEHVSDKMLARGAKHEYMLEFYVRYHYSCVGVIPPKHDTSRPYIRQPDDIDSNFPNPLIGRFILSSDDYKREIEKRMEEIHTQINWPEMGMPLKPMTLTCLTKYISYALSENWTEVAPNNLEKLLEKFCTKIIGIGVKGRKKCIEELSIPLKDITRTLVDYEMSDDYSTLTLFGLTDSVDRLFEELETICSAFARMIEDKANFAKDSLSGISKALMTFLEYQDHIAGVLMKYSTVELTFDEVGHVLQLSGLPEEIPKAKADLEKAIEGVTTDIIPISKAMFVLLTLPSMQEHLESLFNHPRYFVTHDVEESSVRFFSSKKESIDRAKGFVSNNVVQRIILVEDGAKYFLKTLEWEQFCKDQEETSPGNIAIDVALQTGKVTVAVLPKKCKLDKVVEEIEKYLKKKTIIRSTVSLHKTSLKLLLDFKERELQTINQMVDTGSMEECLEDSCIRFEGTSESVHEAKKRLKEMMETQLTERHKINKIGIPKYVYHEHGQAKIAHLEREYKVIIDIVKGGEAAVVAGGIRWDEHSAPVTSIDASKSVCKVSVCGVTIFLVQTDITGYKSDIIVNAANKRLQHTCGVAKAIVDKGGRVIQDECDSHTNVKHSEMEPGETFTSTAGNLPCRRIIHAVSPQWNGGSESEVQKLYAAVYSTLAEGESLTMSSIALPAIGAGEFGVPPDVCAVTIINAISDFIHSADGTKLSAISIVDINKNVMAPFLQAFVDEFPNVDIYDATMKSSLRTTTLGLTNLSGFYVTAEDVSVSLKMSDLIAEQTDAIVNSTSVNFDEGTIFNKGIFSNTSSIKKECKRLHPNGVKSAEVIATNFKGRIVYHAACFNVTTNDQTLKQTVKEALKTAIVLANAKCCKTISIPALWTSGTQSDTITQDLIGICLEAIAVFSRIHIAARQIEHVQIVVPKTPKGLYEICERALMNASFTVPAASNDTVRIQHNNRTTARSTLFAIRIGDIATQRVDVIVNTTSTGLNLSSAGNVSQRILDVAGTAIQDECRRVAPQGVTYGEIAVTAGYGLPVKHVYHGACPSWDPKSAQKMLNNFVTNCLSQAHRDNMTSIAFPAIATGGLGYPPGIVGETMVSAIKEFKEKHQQTPVANVLVICRTEDVPVIQAFENELGKTDDYTLDVGGNMCIAESVQVHFHSNGITTCQVDAILNSTTCSLDLTHGTISSSVLNVAGQEMQDECNKVAPNGINYNIIAVTGGYKLPCQFVFHCALPSWDRSISLLVISNIVKNSLAKAAEMGLRSVAFPPIGSKGLGYPTDEVIQTICSTIERFRKTAQCSVTDVYFAFLPNDIPLRKKYEMYCITHFGRNTEMVPMPVERQPRPEFERKTNRSTKEAEQTIHDMKLSKRSNTTLVAETKDSCKCYIGQLMVEVIRVPVQKIRADVVYLAELGGSDAFSGDGTFTSKTERYDLDVFKKPVKERNYWRGFLTAALADSSKVRASRVAFPSFSGKTQVINVEELAGIMIKKIAFEETNGNCKHLETIFITAEAKNVFDIYKRELVQCSEVSTVVFDLYTFENDTIPEVMKELDAICEAESIEYNSPAELGDTIGRLSDRQVDKIKEFERNYPLRIFINRKGHIATILGLRGDIDRVVAHIRDLQVVFLKEDKESVLIATRITTTLQPHEVNKRIEEAQQNQETMIHDLELHGMWCKVDLKKKLLLLDGKKEMKRVVLDKDDSIRLPKVWVHVPDDKPFVSHTLGCNTKEYKNIVTAFSTTIGTTFTITQIDRIQNPLLYKRYMVKKQSMEQHKIKQPERKLWHGTSQEVLHSINRDGFNRSYCGVNGTAYGKGVYFARDASYSNNYTRPKGDGLKYMFHAQVLVGRYAIGSSPMKSPPAIPGEDGLYNSVVDSMDNPSIFVIFFDDQVYPGYLITYKS